MKIDTFEKSYFRYRGVDVKIRHPFEGYTWCYYLYINLSRLPQPLADELWLEADKDGLYYPIPPIIRSLEFHGGCTWYSKHYSHNDKRVIEVGCDYAHLWDEDLIYSLEQIVLDAKHSVDMLHANTEYLVWCQGNGGTYKESEGTYVDDVFYSHEWIKKEQSEGRMLDVEVGSTPATA